MTHPPSGPSTPTPPPGPKVDGYADLLRLLEASLTGHLEAAELLPEPADADEATGQAVLAFRLKMLRSAARDLLARIPTPAPSTTAPLSTQVAAHAHRRLVDPAALSIDWAGLR